MKFGQWLGLIALLATLVLLWNLRGSLVLIFTAIVLAMALCTLVGAVKQRLNCSRSLAMTASLVGLIVVASVVSTAVIPPFADQFGELILQLPRAAELLFQLVYDSLVSTTRMLYGSNNGDLEWLTQSFASAGLTNTSTLASSLGGGALRLLGLASNLSVGLLQGIFVVGVALMIAFQPDEYREVSMQMVPSFYRRRFRQVLLQCGQALSAWMVGVMISSFCVGLLAAISLSLLGVKLVAANAVLAGILNIIPNVGPTLSTIFPMAVALLQTPWKAVAVLLIYVLIQQLESYVITPSVMQHQLKLLPGLTLTAQLLFTVLFGPLGLLLALPLAVCLQVLLREVLIHDILDPWKRRRQLS